MSLRRPDSHRGGDPLMSDSDFTTSGPISSVDSYLIFLQHKSQLDCDSGFAPLWLPDFLIDFQKTLTDWAVRKGRAAIFADCGLGKTPMQLTWAQNVIKK